MENTTVRTSIMQTAARLFYERGYSNTGINHITEETAIGKSLLYEHFKSKEDLLLSYLEESGIETLTLLKKTADSCQTPKSKILCIFDYLKLAITQPDIYGCHFLYIVYEIPHDAFRIREQIKKQKDGIRQLFQEILAPADEELLADEIYTLFEGALIASKVHRDPWPIDSARNIADKLI